MSLPPRRERDEKNYHFRVNNHQYELALVSWGCWYIFQRFGKLAKIGIVYEEGGKYTAEPCEGEALGYVGKLPVEAATLYIKAKNS